MSGGDPLATCRNIPLDRVAAALGYRRDPADRARFKRDGSVISINGARFFDHLSGTGGGGAIDLVIHATGCRFRDALHFLGGHEGRGKATALQPAPRRLRLPRSSHRAWPRVRDALVRQRALLLFRTLFDDGFPGLFHAIAARISDIIRSLPERRAGAHSV